MQISADTLLAAAISARTLPYKANGGRLSADTIPSIDRLLQGEIVLKIIGRHVTIGPHPFYRSRIRKTGFKTLNQLHVPLHLLKNNFTLEPCNISQGTSTLKVELLTTSVTDCLFIKMFQHHRR